MVTHAFQFGCLSQSYLVHNSEQWQTGPYQSDWVPKASVVLLSRTEIGWFERITPVRCAFHHRLKHKAYTRHECVRSFWKVVLRHAHGITALLTLCLPAVAVLSAASWLLLFRCSSAPARSAATTSRHGIVTELRPPLLFPAAPRRMLLGALGMLPTIGSASCSATETCGTARTFMQCDNRRWSSRQVSASCKLYGLGSGKRSCVAFT